MKQPTEAEAEARAVAAFDATAAATKPSRRGGRQKGDTDDSQKLILGTILTALRGQTKSRAQRLLLLAAKLHSERLARQKAREERERNADRWRGLR
jgi:hypothetical protein